MTALLFMTDCIEHAHMLGKCARARICAYVQCHVSYMQELSSSVLSASRMGTAPHYRKGLKFLPLHTYSIAGIYGPAWVPCHNLYIDPRLSELHDHLSEPLII